MSTKVNKQAFQQDANRPLANRTCFTMNRFFLGGGGEGRCTARSKFNKFEHVGGGVPVQGDPPVNRMVDRHI